jgi:NADH:ubiquinone oxidoreductase subunit 5 (subunit L)/multisubunit Na+/H+ antiporter MnhA subunit
VQTVQKTATLLLPVLVLFAVLYVVHVAGDTIRFAFLDPDRWHQSEPVHPDAPAPWTLRMVYTFVSLLPVAFGLFAIHAALRMVVLIRGGVLFDDRISRRLRQVGIGTGGSGGADFAANLVSPTILSWANPAKPAGPDRVTWYFDSEPAGLIVCGFGFCMIGWIVSEARKLSDDNEGFI